MRQHGAATVGSHHAPAMTRCNAGFLWVPESSCGGAPVDVDRLGLRMQWARRATHVADRPRSGWSPKIVSSYLLDFVSP